MDAHTIIAKLILFYREYSAIATAAGTFLVAAAMSVKGDKPLATELRAMLALPGVAGLFVGPGAWAWGKEAVGYLATLTNAAGLRVYQPAEVKALESIMAPQWGAWALAIAAAIGLWWPLFRWAPARAEAARAKLTLRTRAAREGRTDIRTVADGLPKNTRPYDPAKFFKKDAIFLGLTAKKKPLYVPYSVFRRCHVQLVGTTGAGKGVAAGLMIAQAIRQGEAAVILDPKDDEWAPHLCRQEAEQLGVPFLLIDLRAEVPQINLLAGASPAEVEELLVAGLALSDRGDPADHYRVRDRRAARELARRVLASNPNATLADLFEAGSVDKAMVDEAAGLIGRLGELASVEAVCAPAGADIASTITAGGVVYVIGSMRHAKILALQRALLVRLCQIVERRDRLSGPPRQVLIFLDELKAHISRPALEMLGAIRDKGAHLVLAHQSLGDLRDCPNDLNPDAVQDAVIENCKLRVAYKVMNADTAEWLAATTGKILIDDETRKIDVTGALVEQATGERSIKVGEKERLDSNVFLALPDRVAAIFAPGILDVTHVEPLTVGKAPLTLSRAPAPAPAQPAVLAAAPLPPRKQAQKPAGAPQSAAKPELAPAAQPEPEAASAASQRPQEALPNVDL